MIPKKGFLHEYLIAIINSKLMSYYHTKAFTDEYKSRFQKILIKDAKMFPIKNITEDEQMRFKSVVVKIIAAKNENPNVDTTELENEVDQLIYKLYKLSPHEIKIIEESI